MIGHAFASKIVEFTLDLSGYMLNLNVGLMLSVLLSFYTFYFILVPRFLANKKIGAFIGYGVAVSILSLAFGSIPQLLKVVADQSVTSGGFSLMIVITWSMFLLLGIIFYMVNGLFGALIKGFISWYDQIHVKEILEKRNVQIELALVRAQMNPHFLFNTLNNIDILIERNQERASLYLKKLSDILRFSLYETRDERIALFRELEYIQKYIDLQRIRTDNEGYVSFSINGDPGSRKIVPMLFIPFIENAFKHAVNKKVKDAIVIGIEIEQHLIRFSCRNVINFERAVSSPVDGLGVDLIRQRLQLLYGQQHELSMGAKGGFYEVNLMIEAYDN